jgi:CubicO group peptidase (beta-lactamase class C family)
MSVRSQLEAEVRRAFPDLSRATPGYALRVFSDRSVRYERCHGLANVEHRIPIAPDSVFPLSSVTKPLTAMVVLMTVERDDLTLDTHLLAVVDELPSTYADVRLWHLLDQTSGILDPYVVFEQAGRTTHNLTNADVLAFLRELCALASTPGATFAYSNANYVLLAEILERVEGMPYAEILRKQVFTPLGMEQSLVYDDRYVIPHRAYGYVRGEGGWRTQSIPWLSYGDGGVHTTLEEGTRWGQALLTHRLLSRSMQEAAWSAPAGASEGEVGYGYGWAVRETPHGRIVYHTGGDPGFGSLLSLLPERNVGLLVLANVDGAWRAMRALADRVYLRLSE